MEKQKEIEVIVETTVKATDTDTTGKNSYLVALKEGGLMECPKITYSNYQVIHADSEDEALDKYNTINKCDFFYGAIIKKL